VFGSVKSGFRNSLVDIPIKGGGEAVRDDGKMMAYCEIQMRIYRSIAG
jgi:hypothetical protein